MKDYQSCAEPQHSKGETGGDDLRIAFNGQTLAEDSIANLENAWRNALPSHLDRTTTAD
ncbi:MAG: hypothetical protein ACREEM_35645 [Blastocatellia bacterium]